LLHVKAQTEYWPLTKVFQIAQNTQGVSWNDLEPMRFGTEMMECHVLYGYSALNPLFWGREHT